MSDTATTADNANLVAAATDGFQILSGQTLVCFGDSITQNSVGYCPMIAALIAANYPDRGIRVVNAGIGGNKIHDLLGRVDRDVLAHKPDWVTVSVGINDVWHGLGKPGGMGGVPIGEYRAGLEELVDRLAAGGARVVLLPPTVIDEDPASDGNVALRPYRAAVREIGAAQGLLIAPTDYDLDTALAANLTLSDVAPGKTLTNDGVHLRGPGDAVLAVAVLKTLGFLDAKSGAGADSH